jgi:hypothetical protein
MARLAHRNVLPSAAPGLEMVNTMGPAEPYALVRLSRWSGVRWARRARRPGSADAGHE